MIIFLVILFVTLGEGFYFLNGEAGEEYIVELREDGFFPEEITIRKGEQIKFTTTRGKSFWPASNLHPTHRAYPEFDPLEPIEPHMSWSFRFDKAGQWEFHDHLAPIYKGKIIVLEEREVKKSNPRALTCEEGTALPQCWEKSITTALDEKGVEAALDVLADLYNAQPSFPRSCHIFVHLIGEKAYELFAQQKPMDLTEKTFYCGYGFYHGFAETLFATSGNPEEAREFCEYADRQQRGGTVGCYHGIGHGAVDGGDPRAWGDSQSIITPALELCEIVADTQLRIERCASGVFNSLAIAYNNSLYGLSLNREDPFWICGEQSKHSFKKACYQEMNTVVIGIVPGDFSDVAKYVEKIGDDRYARFAIESLSSYDVYYRSKDIDHDKNIRACRNLQERLRPPCIKGYVMGLLEHGKPEFEYTRGLEFCQSALLTKEERQLCFKQLTIQSQGLYPPEKVEKICEMADEKYRKYCPYDFQISEARWE